MFECELRVWKVAHAASVGAANDRPTEGQVVPTQQTEALVGHGNRYDFGAGLCWLRRQSYSARFEHRPMGNRSSYRQWYARRATRIRKLQCASQPGLSRGRSVGTHGNGAAVERRSEVQPLVLTGREPEQQGGVTDVTGSSSHSMPLACCCLFSIPQKLNASPRRMATMFARRCN